MERDPKEINIHTEVSFNDVFGEPEHVETVVCNWLNSKTVFTYTLNYVYKALSVMFSLLMSLLFGILYAFLTFLSVWCVEPLVKFILIIMEPGKKLYTAITRCILDPLCGALGHCIHMVKHGRETST